MIIRGDLKIIRDLFINAVAGDVGKSLTVDSEGKVVFGGASEITVDPKKIYTKGSLVSDIAETGLYLANANGAPGSDLTNSKWVEISGGKLANAVTVHGVGRVGAVNEGDVFIPGMDSEAILRKLLTKSVKPTLAVSVSPALAEVGSSQSILITPTYKQNDAGTTGEVKFKRDGGDIHIQSGSTAAYRDPGVKMPNGVLTYKVGVTYAKSSLLPAGVIEATKTARGAYANFGYSTSIFPANGGELRQNAGTSHRSLGNTFSFKFTANGPKMGIIAIPKGKTIVSVIVEGMDIPANVTNDYVKVTTITTIPDGGGDQAPYDVYHFNPTAGYNKDYTHKVTIR